MEVDRDLYLPQWLGQRRVQDKLRKADLLSFVKVIPENWNIEYLLLDICVSSP